MNLETKLSQFSEHWTLRTVAQFNGHDIIWLQFIFIPRVKSMIETGEKFPPDSHNGAQAVREFDGDDKAQGLVALLSEFDEIIRQGSRGWRRFFG